MSSPGGPEDVLPPIAALRRIAFLLERSRADTYKVQAFRKAAATVLAVSPERLAELVEAKKLTDLPDVGPSTATVITDHHRGLLSERLQLLEESAAGPLVAGGDEIRVALRGDLHSHSDWSDGGSPIEEMAMTAVELGHEYLVLTDHSPSLRVANGLSAARLTRQFDVIDAVNDHLAAAEPGFTLLKGIEVDILLDGQLDQSEEMLAQLDLRVASVHSKLRMESAPMTRRMIAAIENPHTNVLGHCTGQLVSGSRGTRPQSEFDAEAVFSACAARQVAVEINSRPERQDPPDDLLRLAIEAGCVFSIDSDAHAPGQLDFLGYGCARAEAAGIDPGRIINTWRKDDLLAWARKG